MIELVTALLGPEVPDRCVKGMFLTADTNRDRGFRRIEGMMWVGWGEHWSLLDSPPWYASDVASWLGWKDPERVVFDADS